MKNHNNEQNTDKKCGIIMPISSIDDRDESHWIEVRSILTEAIESAGFEANLVSDSDDVGIIQKRIIQNLYDNPIVICDVSGKNPNVMFELGIRLAFDKPTIIIKDNETSYSFDTSPIEHLEYPRDLRFYQILDFKKSLVKKINGTVKVASDDPNHSTFLKHFGTFTSAKLDESEVSVNEYLLSQMQEISHTVSSIARQFPRINVNIDNPSDQIKETEEKVNALKLEIETQQKIDKQGDIALRMLFQIISGESFTEEEIEDVFSNSPPRIIELGLGLVGEERKRVVTNLLDNENSPKIDKLKKVFNAFIPLLSVLIKIEKSINSNEKRRIDHHVAALSYLYKDRPNPNWNKALEHIEDAIKLHKTFYSDLPVLPIYKFNKFICLINTDNKEKTIKAFDDLWNDDGKGCEMLVTAREIISPNIHQWVINNNKIGKIKHYLEKHPNLPRDLWDD